MKDVLVIVPEHAISHVVVHHQQMDVMVAAQHACMNAPTVPVLVLVQQKDLYQYRKHVMDAHLHAVLHVVITVPVRASADVANLVLDALVHVTIHVKTIVLEHVRMDVSQIAQAHAPIHLPVIHQSHLAPVAMRLALETV